MPSNRLITLLTDFGLNDVYVGVMKGVIASIDQSLRVIDLTHQIPPQNITAAQFNLLNAYPYLPSGTVHVAVVDPGVGSDRRAVAIELEDGFLVGPDNGLFTGLMTTKAVVQAVELSDRQYWRVPDPSNTFHGRDIFAPVAAHLALGVSITKLGEIIDSDTLIQNSIASYKTTAAGYQGKIQHIDRFGNVITNIPGKLVQNKRWSVRVKKRSIPGCQRYGEAEVGNPIALVGSHGWVEIAINGGDAHFQLRLNWEDEIDLKVEM